MVSIEENTVNKTAVALAILGLFCIQPAFAQNAAKPTEKPVDNGPTTPGANNAYQGRRGRAARRTRRAGTKCWANASRPDACR